MVAVLDLFNPRYLYDGHFNWLTDKDVQKDKEAPQENRVLVS